MNALSFCVSERRRGPLMASISYAILSLSIFKVQPKPWFANATLVKEPSSWAFPKLIAVFKIFSVACDSSDGGMIIIAETVELFLECTVIILDRFSIKMSEEGWYRFLIRNVLVTLVHMINVWVSIHPHSNCLCNSIEHALPNENENMPPFNLHCSKPWLWGGIQLGRILRCFAGNVEANFSIASIMTATMPILPELSFEWK